MRHTYENPNERQPRGRPERNCERVFGYQDAPSPPLKKEAECDGYCCRIYIYIKTKSFPICKGVQYRHLSRSENEIF